MIIQISSEKNILFGAKIGARLYLSFAKTVHVGVVENPFVEIND